MATEDNKTPLLIRCNSIKKDKTNMASIIPTIINKIFSTLVW